MAAGRSSRFGENKLLAQYGGRSLIERALSAVPADRLDSVVVVTHFDEVCALAGDHGFGTAWNGRPEDGISLTIRIGLTMLRDMDAVIFMVCDQPKLTRASVAAEVDFYCEHPGFIVSMSAGGARGNPCIFPSEYFGELGALTGDAGGSAVIRNHEDSLRLFELEDASELSDIDSQADIRM